MQRSVSGKSHKLQGSYGYITDQSKCRQCGVCIRECYADAREIMGRKYNEDELLAEILKDRQYYGMSGGGVTFQRRRAIILQ